METHTRAGGLTKDDLHREIRHQHQGIRGLLGRTATQAAAVIAKEDPADVEALRPLLRDLLLVLELHLAFEERTLVPLMQRRGGADRELAQHLLDEHQRQRRALVAMEKDLLRWNDPRELGLLVELFVADVLKDMHEEERGLAAL